MKLRNKKTGKIIDGWSFYDGYDSISIKYFTYDNQVNLKYNSLAELNEEWEDYKPAEPLIKDEKIRRAVRAWAEANNVNLIRIVGVRTLQSEHQGIEIGFNSDLFVGWVRALKTIDELCGEEE